ncbi:hypothetical protein U9M48_032384 [Paspalum notatum var. saurae]|uniref:DDE Tnp4 domain-containing protein n=1 Tax=Paspalum notatum var. saurae TaxID=547442 RepID=A0AAQ3U5U9_PASNO
MMTLHDPRDCFNMFRMTSDVFHRLHDVLVSKYGLKSTKRMSSLESLAMFLWMVGAPQSFCIASTSYRQYCETRTQISKRCILGKSYRFSPYFDNLGAIDGTHIPIRDTRVFNDAIRKYGDKFPHPPPGKFYLVDSGYPNRPGYLAPYKSTKYHLPEYRQGPRPSGKKEVFNYLHSSLRNVIERSFGVLKMKWRILSKIPSYPMLKQTKIILACMGLHNFIRESALSDADFDRYDRDESYMPISPSS